MFVVCELKVPGKGQISNGGISGIGTQMGGFKMRVCALGPGRRRQPSNIKPTLRGGEGCEGWKSNEMGVEEDVDRLYRNKLILAPMVRAVSDQVKPTERFSIVRGVVVCILL